ncbi:MAG: protein-L-isoaspartate o-methyltransferase 1 [Thermomicrobiales bacterium]
MDETAARRIVSEAIDQLGGSRTIVGSPRHPFRLHSSDSVKVGDQTVVVHYGEMSSPAIAMTGRWVFEIKEHELVLLDRPRERGSD